MPPSEDTFDVLWTNARFQTLGERPHRETIRPERALSPFATLPRLTIGAETDPHPAAETDLALCSTLGEGGMGIVYLAKQASLHREVAIKQIRANSPPQASAGLVREAQIMGGLEHPQIIPVHALGVDARGLPSLVMKKVTGETWRTLIHEPNHPWWKAEASPDPLVRHVELLIDVCKAVYFANQRHVIHRDLKPDNVMVGSFGEVYVLDWGIAVRIDEEVDSDSVAGTPSYMAPEMVDERAPLSAATDVYLLGACLHEVLTGEPRHVGNTMKDILRSIHRSAPVVYAEEIPAALGAICNRACHADPAQRYTSALELQRALANWLRTRQATTLTALTSERFQELVPQLSATAVPPEARTAIRERFSECRYGFRQAFDLGDESAEVHLIECFRAMIPFELANGGTEAAAGLIQKLREHGASDLQGFEAAYQNVLQNENRTKKIAHDYDFNVAAKGRQWGVAMFAITALVLIGVLRLVTTDVSELTPKDTFFVGLTLTGLATGITVAMRKSLFANKLSRSFSMMFLGTLAAVTLHRAFGWQHGMTVDAMLAGDQVITLVGAVGATALSRRFLALILLALLGVAIIWIWPAGALPVFGATSLATFVISAWVLRAPEE